MKVSLTFITALNIENNLDKNIDIDDEILTLIEKNKIT
jgi:hypothetical protein